LLTINITHQQRFNCHVSTVSHGMDPLLLVLRNLTLDMDWVFAFESISTFQLPFGRREVLALPLWADAQSATPQSISLSFSLATGPVVICPAPVYGI
jgi:hypothetical protein